ncbi:MAG: hypothetical protein DMG62_21615 [Acidobacteria bacterium]|nr:MAG: hypothetical protein DMG62_21615 [Acidobacteriota bacterium]
MIGVIFDNIKYKEDDMIYANHPPKPIPKNLIDAWKDQLFYFQPADVEFSVQDKKFYACSSILSKRSKYFTKILLEQWSESTAVRKESSDFNFDNDVDIVDVENSSTSLLNNNNLTQNNDKLTCQIKHHIEISKYDTFAFSAMLEYIYTDQVRWTDKDNNSITVELFRLADQYLLSDLRERAKIRILDELKISNVSKIMFDLVPKYEDLKESVLEFMAKNFERINNSKEFKDILANLVNYPNYDVILTEIWAECFKTQRSK